jgi:hypothetical protein
MSDIRLDSLPSWAPFAIIGGVVVLLVVSQRGGGGGAMVGSVTTLAPAPADPNVIAEMNAETAAREHGFDSLIGLFSTRVMSDRDVTISTLNADVQNRRTSAQLNAANYAESVRHDVGIAATDASVAIERARADASVRITDSQGATQKYVAKKENNPINHVIDQVGNVISKLNPFHW